MKEESNNNEGGDNLKQQAVSSTAWGFLDKGSNVVASFIIGIVLARLLPPSDFGLIGLAMIVVGFGQIFVNLGFGPSLIHKQNLTSRHIRVVLTTSVVAGSILSITVFGSAPLAAKVFDNNAIVPIVKALSVIFVIAGFQIPSRALLKKRLEFRYIFYVSLGKSILYGIISITFALLGFGVWSLVIGNIFQRIVSFLGSYWYVRHDLKPLFAKKEFKDLVHFGSGETLNGIFNYFARKGDYFIIGRLLGTEALGLYTKSYRLMVQPAQQIVAVLADVLFPTTVKIKDDSERFKNIFLKTMRAITFTALPFCSILVLLAPELIIGLYGKNWAGAIRPVQILGLFGVFRALYKGAAAFLRAKGWIYPIFWGQVAYGSSMIAGVWIGASLYGLDVAVFLVGVSIMILWLIMMELNIRAQHVKRSKVYGAMLPGIVLSVILSIIIYVLKVLVLQFNGNYLINLIILGISSFTILIVLVLYLPQNWIGHIPQELLLATKNILSDKLYNKLTKIITRNVKV